MSKAAIEQFYTSPIVLVVLFIDPAAGYASLQFPQKRFFTSREHQNFVGTLRELDRIWWFWYIQYKLWVGKKKKKKKCYDGLGLVWSGDKCVSFRGRRIKQERAAVR